MELDLALPSPRSAGARPPGDAPVGAARPERRSGRVRPVADGLWPLDCGAARSAGRGTADRAGPAAGAAPSRRGSGRTGADPAGTGCTGRPGRAGAPGTAGRSGQVIPLPGASVPADGGAPQRPGGAAPSPAPAPPSRDALGLLRQAAEQLAEAHRETEPLRRYPAAYLAALRAGAAVLAMRARPRTRRGAPRDVWRLLAEVAPELEEWAAFFAGCSRLRIEAEAGIGRHVDRRAADDLLRQAEQFVTRVQLLLPR
ncbi:SAV_6107 family HEPN domain-containing protein [Pseudonocardia tropica]|uniref:SAV_6107 family HEPN domain-containing protein n=1 Tax=Pseudonocardia tropica TaxID=681289 RepID=A0ABV1JT57_9PSEU